MKFEVTGVLSPFESLVLRICSFWMRHLRQVLLLFSFIR